MPLAASWLLMGLELPAVTAVVARLPDARVMLAAYGGVVFPLAMIVEAPIIMLLSASTALSKDWSSYLLIRRFMMWAGAGLTLVHALLAFTPLFDLVVLGCIRPPAEIVEPTRLGLKLMLPWTWSIAYRRFQQGVLIRDGRSRFVGLGTVVRLSTLGVVLGIGYWLKAWSGAALAACAVASGVAAEALIIGWVVRPSLRRLARLPALPVRLEVPAFLRFYVPLALTSLMHLLSQPIGSAALSRMPRALDSLAAWPGVSGLSFTLRSVGIAFSEVVIALLALPGAPRALRRFAISLAAATTAVFILLAATPLGEYWFRAALGLPDSLAVLAARALWWGIPLPALAVFQSWFGGRILYAGRSRGITEAVAVSVLVNALALGVGVVLQRPAGLDVAVAGLTVANVAQILLLRHHCRRVSSSSRPAPAASRG